MKCLKSGVVSRKNSSNKNKIFKYAIYLIVVGIPFMKEFNVLETGKQVDNMPDSKRLKPLIFFNLSILQTNFIYANRVFQ